MNLRNRLLSAAIILLIPLAFTDCGSSRRTVRETEPERNGIAIAGRFVADPVMRIGLEEAAASVVTVKADGGLRLVALPREVGVEPERRLEQVSFFVAEAGGRAQQAHRVQVASLSDRHQAERLAEEIRRKLELAVVVRHSSQTRTWRVQVGESTSREEAAKVERTLRAAGYSETWVVRDAAEPASGGSIAAVDAAGRRIAVAPLFRCAPHNSAALITCGDTGYRGAFELRISNQGRIIPVNIINIDDYLRGVVPVEMSPTAFPQLEALKAQAVAARTYAFKNRGQYAAEGYDICESARCQVYKGAGVEHSLTDRAVRETAGEVITFGGKPINALFTSTCGGHTEDAANIFPGDEVTYLKGVVCEPEAELFSRVESAGQPQITYGADGLPLDFELAALRALGVIERDFAVAPHEPVTGTDWSRWLSHAAARLGLPAKKESAPPPPTLNLKDSVSAAAAALEWGERIDRQVSEGDLMLLADFEGTGGIDPPAGRAALYFLRLGLIGPDPDGRLAFNEPLRQTAALRMLHRLMMLEAARGIVKGRLARVESDKVYLRMGQDEQSFDLVPDSRLFKNFQEFTVPVRSLQMAPGDEITLFLRTGGGIGVMVHSPSLEGIASDRSSRYFQWDVRYSPAELRERIARYADVGTITDLRPLRYGVSERIVELEVVGSAGSTVLKGLQIRWALGLRENLFVIEKRYGGMGQIESWRFIGKGWGHGVGLCQVGASGMAITGKGYRQILQHYYTGVEINKLY